MSLLHFAQILFYFFYYYFSIFSFSNFFWSKSILNS